MRILPDTESEKPHTLKVIEMFGLTKPSFKSNVVLEIGTSSWPRGHAYWHRDEWVIPTWKMKEKAWDEKQALEFELDVLLAAALVWQYLAHPDHPVQAVDGPVLVKHLNTLEKRFELKRDISRLLKTTTCQTLDK
jgi:hypothetical protein